MMVIQKSEVSGLQTATAMLTGVVSSALEGY